MSDRAASDRAMSAMTRSGLREVYRVLRGHRRGICAAAALTLTGSALGLAQPLVVKNVIQAAGAGSAVAGTVALLVALFLAQALVQAVGRYVMVRTGEGWCWVCGSTSSTGCCGCRCAPSTGTAPVT
ncbi:hypothetical protein ACFQ0X_07930 [Streptomyces rectiviolaceus]|uniref:hypothetical protein n=1 Tax=Streptomyces rectiviolaceus TaxID=332591 RepID=UPI0036271CB4